jgi:hypothetical protein
VELDDDDVTGAEAVRRDSDRLRDATGETEHRESAQPRVRADAGHAVRVQIAAHDTEHRRPVIAPLLVVDRGSGLVAVEVQEKILVQEVP